jgi:hypothetical protein
MIEEREFTEYKFAHTDEFGQEYKFESKLALANIEESSPLDVMVEQFNKFLKAAGWSQQVILSE